ncbi:MAG: helix-turn-helix transcriptional regulator [Flavobacteriia bacterium]|nr:helix-turn-helix transcriptional regulator [Flavobacteriia bacterium]
MKKCAGKFAHNGCEKTALMAVKDSLDVLSGSWKLPILVSLANGPKRFNQISKEVEGISDKMLSKELKDLEQNHLITRSVQDTFPPTVMYDVTEHAETLDKVIKELRDWGIIHRKKIIG